MAIRLAATCMSEILAALEDSSKRQTLLDWSISVPGNKKSSWVTYRTTLGPVARLEFDPTGARR